MKFSRPTGDVLKLFVNQNRPPLQVYAIPGQAAGLPTPHTGEKYGQIDCLEAVAMDRFDECCHSVIVQRFDLRLFRPRELTGVGGIDTDISDLDRLLERFVENTVDIFYGFRGEAWLAVLIGPKAVIELLDGVGV